jgi:hypothetical protein
MKCTEFVLGKRVSLIRTSFVKIAMKDSPSPDHRSQQAIGRNSMGNMSPERRREVLAAAALVAQGIKGRRMALANKIALVIVDRISADIIRPGPKPEERECYVMAQELRDMAPDLAELISKVLAVEANESASDGEGVK